MCQLWKAGLLCIYGEIGSAVYCSLLKNCIKVSYLSNNDKNTPLWLCVCGVHRILSVCLLSIDFSQSIFPLFYSGEKPYLCSRCQKSFSHSGSYSAHIKKCKPLAMQGNHKPQAMQGKSEILLPQWILLSSCQKV